MVENNLKTENQTLPVDTELDTNSTTDVIEGDRELTDEEKKALYIEQLKKSKIRFRAVQHFGKVTVNKFDAAYKAKRKNKNKAQRKSRKQNR